jgi:hypothetical protein
MLFTLGELIVVIIAFILITYYIFSIKLCKHEENEENVVEDMSGNLTNKLFLMKLDESSENYSIFKDIININNYKTYNSSNIKLWIPFFARDIQIDENDILMAKNMKEQFTIFIEILYPRILSKSLEVVKTLDKIKIIFGKEPIIMNSCDKYIRYIKDYLTYMLITYINNMVNLELQLLQKNEETLIKINTLLINLNF